MKQVLVLQQLSQKKMLIKQSVTANHHRQSGAHGTRCQGSLGNYRGGAHGTRCHGSLANYREKLTAVVFLDVFGLPQRAISLRCT